MNAAERVEQMFLLCKLEEWSLEQFKIELETRYPNGPDPNGTGWSEQEWSIVEQIYREEMPNG